MAERETYVVFVDVSGSIEVEAESKEDARKQVLEELRYKDVRMLWDWNDPIENHAISDIQREEDLDKDPDDLDIPEGIGDA